MLARLLLLTIAVLALHAAGSERCVAQSRTRKSTSSSANQPDSVPPRDVRSKNFLVHTDLNDRDAQDLLERLETMLQLISRYWGAPNRKVIECYVVKDLDNWPPGSINDPAGLASIQRRGGVTRTTTTQLATGRILAATSVVYAVADRGTPQHEAVHAYCGQTFGRTGPLWYSEGMAEMGNYWVENDARVNCHESVVEYIHSVPPKSLNDIVNSNEQTGDSWQNYAWRWALCHLLANNPNYRQRFRPLGLALLNGKRTSFEQVYGAMAKEISFEYLFFLEHFDIGYRADLVAWDWKTKFRAPRGSSPVLAKIEAQAGWQPTRCLVKKDTEYEFSAAGEWQTDEESGRCDADGRNNGTGQLVGILFDTDTYELGEPFELGVYGKWTAPRDGQLYVRCREDWHLIGDDNSGLVNFRIKFADRGRPLPDPRDG
ncbi:MAG: hypothetical protein ACYTGL_29235 [Planctomycetota bacterium]|jgi:hypothetical protein